MCENLPEIPDSILMGKTRLANSIGKNMLLFKIIPDMLEVFEIIINLLQMLHLGDKILVLAAGFSIFFRSGQVLSRTLFSAGAFVRPGQHGNEGKTLEGAVCFHNVANEIEREKVPGIAKIFTVHEISFGEILKWMIKKGCEMFL
jgi:hypothetical protein